MTAENRKENKSEKTRGLLSTALIFLKGLFLKLVAMITARKETSLHDNARQGHLTLAEITLGVVVAGLVMGGTMEANALVEDARLTATVSQVKAFEAAVTTFRDSYKAYPGDFPEAGKYIPHCTGPEGADCNPFPATAGDKSVGSPNFGKTWASQVTDKTHVPAISANDETVLFWAHLLLADLISGVTASGIKDGQQIDWDTTHPRVRLYRESDKSTNESGFIVGSVNEASLPWTMVDKGDQKMKGLVVMIVTTPILSGKGDLVTADQQPMSPSRAAQIDRKMDDGRPGAGYVQAYGAPTCIYDKERPIPVPPPLTFWQEIMHEWDEWRHPSYPYHLDLITGDYNEMSSARDCGLVFRINP